MDQVKRPLTATLNIGTEILQGEVINTNSAFISTQLLELGLETETQLTVQDDISKIVESLTYILPKVEIIFITGGLGPTSDDITRIAVAEFIGEELVYNEHAWGHIETYFKRFGKEPSASNQRQCYFPKNAEILENLNGTAFGFHSQTQQTDLFILPGPPRELMPIFQQKVYPWLLNRAEHLPKIKKLSWRCIGIGESIIAEKVDEAIEIKDVKHGYRAHKPFIDIKVWYQKDHLTDAEEINLESTLDDLLAPWIFHKFEEDYLSLLFKAISTHKKLTLIDNISKGHIAKLLTENGEIWKSCEEFHALPTLEQSNAQGFSLGIKRHPKEKARVEAFAIFPTGEQFTRSCQLPSSVSECRLLLTIAHLAIKHWCQILTPTDS